MALTIFHFYAIMIFEVFIIAFIWKKWSELQFFGNAYHFCQKHDRRMVIDLRKDGSGNIDIGYLEGDKVYMKKGRKWIQAHDKVTKGKDEDSIKPFVFRIGKVAAVFCAEGKLVPLDPFRNVEATMDQSTMARIMYEETIRLDKKQKVLASRRKFSIPIGYVFLLLIGIGVFVVILTMLPLLANLLSGAGG